jgi:hypothetical protein
LLKATGTIQNSRFIHLDEFGLRIPSAGNGWALDPFTFQNRCPAWQRIHRPKDFARITEKISMQIAVLCYNTDAWITPAFLESKYSERVLSVGSFQKLEADKELSG